MSAHKKKKAADKGPKKIEIRNAKASLIIRSVIVMRRHQLWGRSKSVRAGTMQINESFCRMEKGNSGYSIAISHLIPMAMNQITRAEKAKIAASRSRNHRLIGAIEAGGKSLIPLRVYFKGGLIKVELALCVGKKMHDKRETMKRKVEMREAERAMRSKY